MGEVAVFPIIGCLPVLFRVSPVFGPPVAYFRGLWGLFLPYRFGYTLGRTELTFVLGAKVMKKTKTTKGVAAYVRVSTVGQNEAGQRAEIERWLTGSGINPAKVRWFVDKKTGDTLKRPAFEKLQAAVFAGEVGTVVVYKLDRLSRKLREGLDVLCDWCERGLRVVSVTQQIDFNGTMGKMLAAVLLGIAEMEQKPAVQHQRAGIDVAKKAGKYRGRKPGHNQGQARAGTRIEGQGADSRRDCEVVERVEKHRFRLSTSLGVDDVLIRLFAVDCRESSLRTHRRFPQNPLHEGRWRNDNGYFPCGRRLTNNL